MTTVVTRLFDTYDHARQAVQDLEASGISHDDISLVASNADDRYGTGTLTGGTTGTYAEDAAGGVYADPVTAPGAAVPGTTPLGTAAPLGTVAGERPLAGEPLTGEPLTGEPLADEPVAGEAESTGAGTGATVGTILGGGAGLLAGLGLLAIPGVGPIIAAGWLVATITGAGIGAAGGGILGGLVGAGVPEEEAHVYAEGVRRGGTLVTVRADESQSDRVEALLDGRTPVDVGARRADYQEAGWTGFDHTAPTLTADEVRAERSRRVRVT